MRSSRFVVEATTRTCSNHDRKNMLRLRYISSQTFPADLWKHCENHINQEKEFIDRPLRFKAERKNNVRHAHTSTPPEIFTELWQSLETQIKAENDYKNGPLRWAPPKWQLEKSESERKDLFTEIDKLTTEAEISAVNQTMAEEPPEDYPDNKLESKLNEYLAEEQLKKTVNAELVKSVVAPLLNQPQHMEKLRAQVQMDRKVERGRVAKIKSSVKEMKQRQQDRLPLLHPNINDPESTIDPRKYFDMKKNWSPPKWRGPNNLSPTRESKTADLTSALEESIEEDPVEPIETLKEDERFSKTKDVPDNMDKAIIEMDQRREDKIEVMERVQLKVPSLTIDPQKMFDVRKF